MALSSIDILMAAMQNNLLLAAVCFFSLLPLTGQAACKGSQAELAQQYLLTTQAPHTNDESVISGQQYPSVPLLLNGYGTRTKLLWDVYLTALYLPHKSNDVAEILAMPGRQRVSLYFLQKVSKEKLIEGWVDGFNFNQSDAQMIRLQSRLETASQHFRTMQEGETIHFVYQPARANDSDGWTELYMNSPPGQSAPLERIRGRDFFRAILQIWIGEHPTQKPLKRCLLGQSSSD